MIECKEGRCSVEGTLKEILVETTEVLAATHELCKKYLAYGTAIPARYTK